MLMQNPNGLFPYFIQHLIKNDKYRNETYNTLTMNVRTKDVVEFLDRLVGVEVEMVDIPLLNQYSYTVNSMKIRSTGYYTQDNILDEIFKTLKLLSGLNK